MCSENSGHNREPYFSMDQPSNREPSLHGSTRLRNERCSCALHVPQTRLHIVRRCPVALRRVIIFPGLIIIGTEVGRRERRDAPARHAPGMSRVVPSMPASPSQPAGGRTKRDGKGGRKANRCPCTPVTSLPLSHAGIGVEHARAESGGSWLHCICTARHPNP